jgi:DNA mismatch repair protein MutS
MSSGSAAKGPTPMMKQYLELKAQQPDALMLFRMGDFYETFYEDARIASSVLGLTLTSREKSGDDPIPLAGVPFHALDHYLSKLVAAGHTVAICEQTEDPAQAKGLVRREVVEVVSPGTVTDPALLDETQTLFLLAVAAQGERCGYALLDSSTGEFRCGECDREELGSLARRFRVAEVILAESSHENGEGSQWSLDFSGASLSSVSPLLFEPEFAAETLSDHFRVQSLSGLALDDMPLATRAAGAALRYLADRQRRRPSQVRDLEVEHQDRHLLLDRETIAHLELFEGLRAGERETSLFAQIDNCRTPMGRRRLAAWLRAPLSQSSSINARLDAVQWLAEHGVQREGLVDTLTGTGDLERIAGRVATARALPHQLSMLRAGLGRLPSLTESLASAEVDLLRALPEASPGVASLEELLRTSLVDETPTHLRQGGVIREGFDAALDELRDLDRGGKAWIARYQEEQRERTGISGLKVGFNRVFGYHLEVTNKHLDRVPPDYEEKQRLAGGKRFVTDELKQQEQRILSAQEERIRTEQKLYDEIQRRAQEELEALYLVLEAWSELDALVSLATAAVQRRYVRPVLDDTGEMHIEAGRHPVVEALSTEPFTPNDLRLDASRRLLVLTGPNMGGKSTYLRQAALYCVLAQMGSFVPAHSARLGLVDRVFTRVGASDNLARGQSTFLVEMSETAKILRSATSRSLVIFDEVGRGTSTTDGLALARAIIEYLHDGPQRPKTLFATHFHELTDLGTELARAANIQMEVREWERQILFLHRVVEGASDQSYGVHVAELAGLPPRVLDRARELLDQGGPGPRPVPTTPPPGGPASGQASLFDPPPRPDELRSELASLDPDQIRPIEALQLLADLVERARRDRP